MEQEPNKAEFQNRKEGLPEYVALENIPINENSNLSLLNVRHTRRTIEEFGPAIKVYIENAEILISELYVSEEDTEESDLSEMQAFYSYVTKVADENKTHVIVADPEKNLSQAIANTAVSIAPGLAALGSGAYLADRISAISYELETNRWKNKQSAASKESLEMTRRNFFKAGAAATVVAVGGLNFTAGALEEMGISEDKGELLETFLLSSLDYRNALVAKQIIELGKQHKEVRAIYGAAHAPGLRKFLENPDLLEQKLKLYESTFGLFNESEPKEYNV